jgi:hypothetical protein
MQILSTSAKPAEENPQHLRLFLGGTPDVLEAVIRPVEQINSAFAKISGLLLIRHGIRFRSEHCDAPVNGLTNALFRH